MKRILNGLSLNDIVNNVDSKPGRYFAFFIQFLIVVSIITFSIETIPGLSKNTIKILTLIEYLTVACFTVEYLLRIYVANKRLSFIFSFYGLIDLLAILPFYLSASIDLRSLRVFRFLRLIRILKLLRYSQAIQRFHRALIIVKEELILFGVVSLILLYLSAVGIYFFERTAQPEQFKSVFHSLWWALATLTTVGYGDMYPVTAGGRFFTFAANQGERSEGW